MGSILSSLLSSRPLATHIITYERLSVPQGLSRAVIRAAVSGQLPQLVLTGALCRSVPMRWRTNGNESLLRNY